MFAKDRMQRMATLWPWAVSLLTLHTTEMFIWVLDSVSIENCSCVAYEIYI